MISDARTADEAARPSVLAVDGAWTRHPGQPAVFAVATLASSIFAGNFDKFLPLNLPLNRLCLFAFVLSAGIRFLRSPSFVARPLHWVLLAQVALVAGSAAATGTLLTGSGGFTLLDEILIPLVLVVLVPIAFQSVADRNLFVIALTVVALYVAVESIFQVVGPSWLLFPRYLSTPPPVGEVLRATGPFLQVGANGAALAMCLPICLLLSEIGVDRWLRVLGRVTAVLCLAAVLLTLTRSVWLAGLLGISGFYILDPARRRTLAGVLTSVILGVFTVLLLVPGLFESVVERLTTQRSVDDRTTTNAAALSMLWQNPIFGIGWNRFLFEVDSYVRQLDQVPLTTTHILAHNLLLSRAAEVGTIGALLLIGTLLLGPAHLAMSSRVPLLWRRVLVGSTLAWLSVAMLTPMGYAFPNYLLWTMTALALSFASWHQPQYAEQGGPR